MSHSTTDFDFVFSSWALDTGQYVSAPSSLKIPYPAFPYRNYAILHDSITALWNKAGWQRGSGTNYDYFTQQFMFIFRNPAPDGSVLVYPFYTVIISNDRIRWQEQTGNTTFSNIKTWTGELPDPVNINEWRCWRVSWWNGLTAGMVPCTKCRLEVSIGGIWYPYSDAEDISQLNRGNPIQRCGVGANIAASGKLIWIDDTEFYVPV